jgi:hypothetical protein
VSIIATSSVRLHGIQTALFVACTAQHARVSSVHYVYSRSALCVEVAAQLRVRDVLLHAHLHCNTLKARYCICCELNRREDTGGFCCTNCLELC